MQFKPFFLHRQAFGLSQAARHLHLNTIERHKPVGYTIKVEPVADNDRMCKVAVAFCSAKDQFCKATGRAVVEQQTFTTINKRQLPEYVAAQCDALQGYSGWPGDNDYVLKYVV